MRITQAVLQSEFVVMAAMVLCYGGCWNTCNAFVVVVPNHLPTPTSYHQSKQGLQLSPENDAGSRSSSSSNLVVIEEPSQGHITSTSRRQMILGGSSTIAAIGLFSSQGALAKDLSSDYMQGTAALGSNEQGDPIPKEAYKKLPSGVVYADIRTGSGSEVAQVGSRVNLQWVLRRSNGYFVDSSQVQGDVPFIFTVGDGKAIAGLDEAVQGMKAGSVRRMLIPLKYGYVEGLEDGKPGPLPAGYGPRQQMRRVQNVRKDVPGEYIFLEVQATRVR